MDNKSDTLLRNMLKNWVNQHLPPNNGRAHLLWEATRVSRNKIDLTLLLFHPQYKSSPSSRTNGSMQTLFTWINENSLQYGLQARLF